MDKPKFTQGKPQDLTDNQLFQNLALVKLGKIPGLGDYAEDLYEAELEKRGYDDQDITIKVEDLMYVARDINEESKSKFWGTTERIVDTASDLGDVFQKFTSFMKKGETIEDEGSEYDIEPYEEKAFNWKPYIIGLALVVVVTGGILLALGNKKKKKK